MRCLHPIDAWMRNGNVVFHVGEAQRTKSGERVSEFQIPCGQCINCKIRRKSEWAIRCMHEHSMHEFSSYVTLTYNPEFVPFDGSLNYRDFKRFLRRLKNYLGREVRFFMCGEYGDKDARPHFHAVLFGVRFDDMVFYKNSPSGSALFRSAVLENLWPYGYSTVGEVTFDSAAYVAGYCTKKITGSEADSHYRRELDDGTVYWLTPEFVQMSRKPGIGFDWFSKYWPEVLRAGTVVMKNIEIPMPRYYEKLAEMWFGFLPDEVTLARLDKSLKSLSENAPDRLAVQEVIAKARLNSKKRSL